MSKKKIDIFKGRTKEWDNTEWQGRSKTQVEGTNFIVHYTILTTIVIGVIYGLIKIIANI
jgi:hypothetical protein